MNQNQMLYPEFATVLKEAMPTHGAYAKGWPTGAIVHFTGGHDGARNVILEGITNKFAFWCIQRDGTLFCAHPANRWGYHAGESKWKNLVGGVSDDLIGIEMNAAGRVTKLENGKFRPWWNEEKYLAKQRKKPNPDKDFESEEVRYCDGGSSDQCEGYYQKYTEAQETTLIKTLLWLKAQKPDVFSFDKVLGHCEVSGKLTLGYWRKNDPSAALSMTMPELRVLLKKKHEEAP